MAKEAERARDEALGGEDPTVAEHRQTILQMFAEAGSSIAQEAVQEIAQEQASSATDWEEIDARLTALGDQVRAPGRLIDGQAPLRPVPTDRPPRCPGCP